MIRKNIYINFVWFLITTSLVLIYCSDSQKISNNSSKWFEVDSLLFADSSFVLPYRYSDLFDSTNTRFINNAKTAFDSGATCILPYDEKPKVYMLDEFESIISVNEYLNRYINDFPSNLTCVLRVEIAWTGQVRKIILSKFKGDGIEKIDLEKFSTRLRATPYKLYGLPVSDNIHFYFRLSKQITN